MYVISNDEQNFKQSKLETQKSIGNVNHPDITGPLLDSQESSKRISLTSIRKSQTRYIALALAALLMFGNNYSFDNPQALQSQIMDDLQISSPQYNLLYSAFSLPNIFLTLAGGFMIDLVGVRFGIFCFCSGVLLASLVVALGGAFKIYTIMLIGRAVFGVCSENLIIAQSAIVSKWFKGSELSMAIGIIMTVPELGSAFNSLLSPMLYEVSGSLTLPLFISVAICSFSLICAILLVILDKKADLQEANVESHEEGGVHEKVSFDDIKQFSATFWILVIICMLILGVYVPFLDDANDFYQKKFRFSSVEAGRVLMIPYLTSTLISPFIGKFVDRIGKRRYLLLATGGLYITAHTLFGALESGREGQPNYCSIIPLIIFGTAYASYSCVIIPCVQYVVEQRVMGTAFGIMGMLESIALATFPLIAATIVTSSQNEEKGYSNVGYFFAGIASIAVLLGSSLFFFDQKGSVFLDFINPEKPNDEEQIIINKYKKSKFTEDDEEEDDIDEDDDDDEIQDEEEDDQTGIEEDFDRRIKKKQETQNNKQENELEELKKYKSNLSITKEKIIQRNIRANSNQS